ncbi:hypothetical protein Ddc_05746 [Ditylenchus destructor]|nr:hypothetical protein Ddc_05746 [Ditylenchus destructor]
MSAKEETTPNIVGRARRSAAASSKRAWAALLPGKKSSFSDNESLPDKDDKAERKDAETPKSQTPVETVSQKRARVGGKRSKTSKASAENVTSAAANESPQPDKSQTKSPARKVVQSPARSPSSPKPQHASARIRPSHKVLMSTGSNSALNSDQLRDIEREIDKHLDGGADGLDNSNFEEEEDDETTKRFILDDKNDEDFQLKEKKPAKRSAILKSPATRVASNSSEQTFERVSVTRGGRGRGRPVTTGGIMRGRQNGPARGAMTGAGSPSAQINVRPTMDQGMTGMPPTRRDFDMGGRAPPKVVIMKPRDPQNRNPLYTQGSALPPVPQELNRLHNDNRRHIDYNQRCIDQLKTSHTAQMDLKDERIRQLEQTVENLQTNFLQSRKQMQLNTLKYEIAGKPENSSVSKIQNGQKPGSSVVNTSSSVVSHSMLERDESEPNNKVP